MWHVSSRSGVATLRNAIHLLLTYLWNTNRKHHVGTGTQWSLGLFEIDHVSSIDCVDGSLSALHCTVVYSDTTEIK